MSRPKPAAQDRRGRGGYSGAALSPRPLVSFETSEATTMTAAINPITSVQMALISGFTPSLTSEYIRIGNVSEPGPVVKVAITRSSSDSVNASIQPAAIAGAVSGSVTAINARAGSQPRSIAASSNLRSRAPSRDCTTTATKHMVSVVWAIVIVQTASSALTATNNNSSA